MKLKAFQISALSETTAETKKKSKKDIYLVVEDFWRQLFYLINISYTSYEY